MLHYSGTVHLTAVVSHSLSGVNILILGNLNSGVMNVWEPRT